MKKWLVLVLVCGMFCSFLVAAEDWDSINNNSEEVLNETVVEDDSFDEVDDYVSPSYQIEDAVEDEFYTVEFYIALGIGLIVLVVLGYFVWLFIRGPKNDWEEAQETSFFSRFKIKIKK